MRAGRNGRAVTLTQQIESVREMRQSLDAAREAMPPEVWARADARLADIERASRSPSPALATQKFEKPEIWHKELEDRGGR